MEVQMEKFSAKPIGELKKYLGDSQSAAHRRYKGAYKGRVRVLLARYQM